MLKTLFVFLFLTSTAFAQGMSTHEKYEEAYRTRTDDSSQYLGSCLTHEDYEGINFKCSALILNTLTLSNFSISKFHRRLNRINSNSLFEIARALNFESAGFKDFVDDITIDRIQMSKRIIANLVRPILGLVTVMVLYLVFTQVGTTYKWMSQTVRLLRVLRL